MNPLGDYMNWGIFAAAVVTAIIRLTPVLFLSHRNFPILLRDFLSQVPVAVLTSIATVEIVGDTNTTPYLGLPLALSATMIAIIAGFLTHSLFVTVLISVLAFLTLNHLA